MAETHINAYYAELAIAESDKQAAESRIATLKQQIAALEASASVDAAPAEDESPKEVKSDPKPRTKAKKKAKSEPKATVTAKDAPKSPKDADAKPSIVPEKKD